MHPLQGDNLDINIIRQKEAPPCTLFWNSAEVKRTEKLQETRENLHTALNCLHSYDEMIQCDACN